VTVYNNNFIQVLLAIQSRKTWYSRRTNAL